jgi:ATP-dependent Lhr-like helicase
VARWFVDAFREPTPVQQQAWARTSRHANVLITAPTGSGKTLAAFLAAIIDLVVEGLELGLRDQVYVLYVSPLKALSNDILKKPAAAARRYPRAARGARSGRCADPRRGAHGRHDFGRAQSPAPHTAAHTGHHAGIAVHPAGLRFRSCDAGRHAQRDRRRAARGGGTKRGAHLMLSLERLDALCESPPVRIGLSATQRPIETMARLLMGYGAAKCEIVDTGHHPRPRHRALNYRAHR